MPFPRDLSLDPVRAHAGRVSGGDEGEDERRGGGHRADVNAAGAIPHQLTTSPITVGPMKPATSPTVR